jgi:hypothetical protein
VPDAVALGDAFADAEGAVAGGAVQRDRRAVPVEDGRLQGPQTGGVGFGDLLVDQRLADAAAAVACRSRVAASRFVRQRSIERGVRPW